MKWVQGVSCPKWGLPHCMCKSCWGGLTGYHLVFITSFPMSKRIAWSSLTYKFYFKQIKEQKNCEGHLNYEADVSLILRFRRDAKSLPGHRHAVSALAPQRFLLSGLLSPRHSCRSSATPPHLAHPSLNGVS